MVDIKLTAKIPADKSKITGKLDSLNAANDVRMPLNNRRDDLHVESSLVNPLTNETAAYVGVVQTWLRWFLLLPKKVFGCVRLVSRVCPT